jgi:hypothetical protein
LLFAVLTDDISRLLRYVYCEPAAVAGTAAR